MDLTTWGGTIITIASFIITSIIAMRIQNAKMETKIEAMKLQRLEDIASFNKKWEELHHQRHQDLMAIQSSIEAVNRQRQEDLKEIKVDLKIIASNMSDMRVSLASLGYDTKNNNKRP